ncbi:MAG TPA: hypothetical protein VJT31_41525 [Rugosimonospora sp.]|nr:hypothetical protein [Rugosimonospora sp.]
MLDRVTDSYVSRCSAGDRGLLDVMRTADFPPAFRAAYGQRLLARPLFVADRTLRRFTDDLVAFFHLMTSLPQRLYGGDIPAYCAALGIDAERTEVLRRFPLPPTVYGRADLYHDGETYKLLEFNVGSSLGGSDRAQIPPALLRVDAFARFAAEHGLSYVHTGERIAQAFRDAAAGLTGGADPVVGFVETDGGLGEFLHMVKAFQEMMAGQGVEVVLGEVSQVSERDGRLYLHGRPLDVVLRYFTENEIVTDARVARSAETIFRAHEEGRVVMWTTLASALFHNKGCLALLSDPRSRAALSTVEVALVDRVLPWTRSLVDGPTDVDGQSVDLMEYCRERRADLILKPRGSFGGSGIVVGWEQTDQEWKESLLSCAAGAYLVQHKVVPRPEPVVDPDTGAVEQWSATWGAFVTPDGYAGSCLRALPRGTGSVIGMGANARVCTTSIFSFPEAE